MEQASTSTGKRKRDVLSIEKKLELIKEIKKGATITTLSNQYGIPRTTINDLKKNADKIEEYASRMESLDGRTNKRRTMKMASNDELDEAVYTWFNNFQ